MIKKEQNIFSFSYGFIPSFFFYLCLLIDLSIPLIFFLASEDFSFFSIFLLGDYAGPILGFSSFFGILVFTFYGFVIYLGFPTESRKSAFQLVLRLIPFGFLYLMEDDILASLFKY